MENRKYMSVHEVAEFTGTTARTLHYYDEIGLLKPALVTEAGYRQYSRENLLRLQEILFLREVGFALKEIKALMESPNYDTNEALKNHLAILEAQKERINGLISLVKNRIEGKEDVSFAEFSEEKLLELKEQYREEVIERYKDTKSFQEFEERFSKKSQKKQNEEWEKFLSTAQNIFERLALYEGKSPALPEVLQLVKEWQDYINEHFYSCDAKMLSCLGELYVNDERFASYINQFGKGNLAGFFREAIRVFYGEEGE